MNELSQTRNQIMEIIRDFYTKLYQNNEEIDTRNITRVLTKDRKKYRILLKKKYRNLFQKITKYKENK